MRNRPSARSNAVELKSPAEIQIMREGGRLLAKVLRQVAEICAPGLTTLDLEHSAREFIAQCGAKPAFLGYENYPCALCTSINEQVVHGIPSRRPLREGDILSIDCGLHYKGFFSDAAITVPIGSVSTAARRLSDITRRCLEEAIPLCQPGYRIGDLGACIQECAERAGYNVVRDLTGHGIGRCLHEAPKIPNYGKCGDGTRLQVGMVLAIEPMVNAGGWRTDVLGDDWTVVTADGSLSAHFEHSIAVTAQGPLVLTVEDGAEASNSTPAAGEKKAQEKAGVAP